MKWWTIIGVLLVTGCVRFQPQPLSADQTAAQLEDRSLTNAALQSFLERNLHRDLTNWPALDWNLETLTLAAFYYQPTLEVARAQWRVAEAGIKTAGGRPNPTVAVTPEYNFSTVNAASGLSPWLPAVNFDLPIETAGKRGHRIAQARHLSEAARLNVVTAVWETRARVRAALVDTVAARQRVALLETQAELAAQIVKRLEQRQQAGAASAAEVTPARVALARAGADLAEARRADAEAQALLAEALAVPLRALADTKLIFDLADHQGAESLTTGTVRRQALLGRADVRAALAEYAANQAALQLEVAKQYPDVHLGTGYQFDQGDNKWQLGLTAELPVLNRNQGPIAEAEARRAEAAARFEAKQAKVIAEIDRAQALLDAAGANLAAARALRELTFATTAVAEAQRRAGAADELDILTTRFESNTAALSELDAQWKLQQAIGALEDALQRPVTSGDVVGIPPEANADAAKENAK